MKYRMRPQWPHTVQWDAHQIGAEKGPDGAGWPDWLRAVWLGVLDAAPDPDAIPDLAGRVYLLDEGRGNGTRLYVGGLDGSTELEPGDWLLDANNMGCDYEPMAGVSMVKADKFEAQFEEVLA